MPISANTLTPVELRLAIACPPVVVSPDTTVMNAIAQMRGVRSPSISPLKPVCPGIKTPDSQLDEHYLNVRASCVLVMENEHILGIFTERDVVRLSIQQQPLDRLVMRQVMTYPVISLHEEACTDLFFVINFLEQHHICHLPILDAEESLVGIVTEQSLRQILLDKLVKLEAEKDASIQENRTLELEKQVKARKIALNAKAQPEKLVTDLATLIRSSLSLQTILDTTVEQVRQVLGCDRVTIWQFEAEWEIIAVAESTNSSVSLLGERIKETCCKQKFTEIYPQGRIRVVPDIYTTEMSDCHRQMLIDLQTRAKILVPLLCGDRLWGLLNVTESQHPRNWQQAEVELLQGLSIQLAIALDQATTHQQLQAELNARQQSEVRLRESQQQLQQLNQELEAKIAERTQELWQISNLQQAILNSTNYAIVSTDLTGIIQTFNAGAERMLGYSSAEVVGKLTPLIFHDPEQIRQRLEVFAGEQGRGKGIPPELQIIAGKAEQGIANEEEWILIHNRDGSRFPALVSITALKDHHQQIIGFLGITQDIRERKQAEEIIHEQIEREKLNRQITKKIRQTLDLQTIFDTATQEIRRFLEAERVGIFRFDPESGCDDGEFVSQSLAPGFMSVLGIKVHDHCFGEQFSHLYQQGQIQATNDINNAGLQDCHKAVLSQFQIQANLIVPLLNGEELWGLLCIHQCSSPRQWEVTEINLTQEIANQLAIAIQQASLYKQIQSELVIRQQAEEAIGLQLKQQRTLVAIAQQIRQALDVKKILGTLTQQVKEILQADRVIVFRLFPDGKSQIVEEAVSSEFVTLKDRHWDNEVWSQDILEWYWQGQPRIVPDVMNDIWTSCLVEYSIEGQIQSKIVAPILQEVPNSEIHRWVAPGETNQLWGVLVVHACREKRVWQESESQLLQQIANQLAIAIQQASLFEQLQQELGERQQTQQQLTERNQQLAISNQELARATRLKDEFLANMSHELRTPLNAILGMTEGLQEKIFGQINDGQIRALQTIERSANHLLELINDILDVAKIESGHIELNFASTDIATLCQASLAFIRQQAVKKRIQLEIKLPVNLPDLLVDERRIRQVLINLLNNAVKFTPDGGRITLEVSYQWQAIVLEPPSIEGITRVRIYKTPLEQELGLRAEQEGLELRHYLRIAITDTGIGIEPEDLKKLFQPFVQIDSALNRQYQGTGLGLTLVKRIVELHGGQVEVTSKVGVGSCFMVDLPCITGVISSPPIKTEPVASIPSSQPQQKLSGLILLAEDNEANIITISSYLRAKGYRIIVAKNGEEAIALVKSEHPALILMDIQMPGMDGLAAMEYIRRDLNLVDIPIIALTALAMKGDRDRCLAAGANDYISKPIKLKQLTITIQKFLSSQEYNQ